MIYDVPLHIKYNKHINLIICINIFLNTIAEFMCKYVPQLREI